MTFKSAKEDKRYLTVSDGNAKLKPSDKVKYIIFNLLAMVTCPYATEHCKKSCYARANERYATCKNARIRNTNASSKADFVERMIFTITANLERPSYQNADTIVVRIHEAGDFYNKEYAIKWVEIANHFKGNDKVVFMAYTKSVEFFQGVDIPDNMTLRYSVWDDTKAEQIEMAEKMGLPIYTAVEKFTTEKPVNRCGCVNCSTCKKCWANIEKLVCEIH